MATKQAKIHFLATKGPAITNKVTGSNAIIIQDYDEKKDKYVYGMIDVGYCSSIPAGTNSVDKKRILYDKTLILNYLKLHKISELEFVLITHYHVDHYRGLMYMLKPGSGDWKVNIKNLILPMNSSRITSILNKMETGSGTDGETVPNALKKIEGWYKDYKVSHPNCRLLYFGVNSNTEIRTVCNIGDLGTFQFYNTNPLTNSYAVRPNDEVAGHNWTVDKFSIVTLYEVDGKKILFPADIYTLSEKLMLNRPLLEDCDVIQMSHHGSLNGSCAEFVDFVVPDNKECAAIQLRSGMQSDKDLKTNRDALKRFVNKNNGSHPLVRVYGTWQKFSESGIWGSDCKDEQVASIVLEIKDGSIRYCSRRFVNTDKGYAQKTIPASTAYNINPY